MMMSDRPIDETLDLRGVECPHNTSKAMLELELMDPGQILEVTVDDGEPIVNVPVSLEQEGHHVLRRRRDGGAWILRVERGQDL